jgi:2-(1,2-epoxy-1,2-dihydrophenyl)acetyl-CoA isomerase
MDTLSVETKDGVATVTLDRPERLNVMNMAMRGELRECFERLRDDDAVRVVVVTGAGEAFCAGGDMNDFVDRSAEEMYLVVREKSHRWFEAVWTLPKPTIAAVNGVAAGGGANLLLACDFVVASERARFGETFVKVGLMPDLGGLFLLPRAVGLHQAKALCMTGEVIDAKRAHELGFVHRLVPHEDLLPQARALAEQLAAGPAHAYAAMKAILNRSFELSMDEALQLELYAQSFLFSTTDYEQRRDAFMGRDDGEGS